MTLTENYETSQEKMTLRVGEVALLSHEQAVDKNGRPFFRRHVRVGDESDRDTKRRDEFAQGAAKFEQDLIDHPQWPGTVIFTDPETGGKIVEVAVENEAAMWLYYEADGTPTQMIDWAKDFPTAIALEPLQRLANGGRMLPQGELDPRTLELFTYMVDAIGIRSRARIYAQRLVEEAQKKDGPLKIISVGSGAAVPNIDATKRIEAETGNYVKWKFFDIDPRALKFAHALIEEAEFEKSSVDYGGVSFNVETNEWEFEGRSYARAFKEESESADVVDALGLWEYIDTDEAGKKFLERLYDKVKPGGMMIVSNMLRKRPQEEFNIRGVGWPSLELRSEEDLLRIVELAGIDTSLVTMTHAEDGVYVVMEIRKP